MANLKKGRKRKRLVENFVENNVIATVTVLNIGEVIAKIFA